VSAKIFFKDEMDWSPLECQKWQKHANFNPRTGALLAPELVPNLTQMCGPPEYRKTKLRLSSAADVYYLPTASTIVRPPSQSGNTPVTEAKAEPITDQTILDLKNALVNSVPQTRYQLSDFEIGRRLGAGAFGEVFQAKNLKEDTTVVVKKIGKANLRNKGLGPEDVNAEVAVLEHLSSICHPYVLCYSAYIEDDNYYYIVTEYLGHHENLLDFVKKHPLTPQQKATIMNYLREGLLQIHAAGVAHRDIKPENIMIDTSTLIPTYIDFGLACIESACTTHKAVGTVYYMAPEIAKGISQTEQYNLKSLQQADIWSLGMTEFYLVRGEDYLSEWYLNEFIPFHPNIDQRTLYSAAFSIRAMADHLRTMSRVDLTKYLPGEYYTPILDIFIAIQMALQMDPNKRLTLPVSETPNYF
jgi:serine/threonine protein kinase